MADPVVTQQTIEIGKQLADTLIRVGRFIGAGISMGSGAIGPALGEGYVGGQTVASIARQPELSGQLTVTMLLADAIAESTGIYALVIAFLILFTG
jgi:F-type H+-transporting ATPase subunit c